MSKSISRLQKLENLKDPYPRDFPGRVSIQSVLDWYDINYYNRYPDSKALFKIAGRVSARRDHGNNIFFDLFDQTGTIQLHAVMPKECDWQEIGGNPVCNAIRDCDLGDMVGVSGTIGANPRQEPLFKIMDWVLLAKALREPPDKFHGITDDGTRYRHRELDLMSSADSREVFKTRAKIVFEIRKWLNERDYIEIETPVLQPIYGGATARPFVTHHNALGQKFFLSISSELYLKRALVGGFDRVYSISRCFRNEGISQEHNPEFTNLEIFSTCETYETMKRLTEELLEHTAHSVGSLLPPLDCRMNLPSADWPLSRNFDKNNDDLAEAWEMFAGDMEIASGASDLNDPREQNERLLESEFNSLESKDDIDYDPYDANYIEALEQGALPWAGVGIGVDRLIMLLLDKTNIRDVLLFPLLKNK